MAVSLGGDYEIISRDFITTHAHRMVVKNIDSDSAKSCLCAKCGEFLGIIEPEAVFEVLPILGAPRRYCTQYKATLFAKDASNLGKVNDRIVPEIDGIESQSLIE